jgi:hypothetical protein
MQKLKASRVRIKENCQTPTDLFLQGGARLRARSPFRQAPLTNKEAGGYYVRAGWSSLVARRAHNPEVEGSNPSPATLKNLICQPHSRRSRLSSGKHPLKGDIQMRLAVGVIRQGLSDPRRGRLDTLAR